MKLGRILQADKRIKDLLLKYRALRDDETMLWITYLIKYCNLKNVLYTESMFEKFKTLVTAKETPTLEELNLIRRKLQREDDSLRGVRYEDVIMEEKSVESWFTKSCKQCELFDK